MYVFDYIIDIWWYNEIVKALLLSAASVLSLIVIGTWYFFNHGYSYQLPSEKQQEGSLYHFSPQCYAQQQQLQVLIAPLQAQASALTAEVVAAPKPWAGGGAEVAQYNAIQAQINALEIKYNC